MNRPPDPRPEPGLSRHPVAVAVLFALLALAAGCSRSEDNDTTSADGDLLDDDIDCESMIHEGRMPTWAAGAGIDAARYVVSDDDLILGVLWADPLIAGEPSPDRPNNKILWVVSAPRQGSDLQIAATPYGRSEPVVHHAFPDDSGPGEIYPSIVDFPEPGCWQLELRWADSEAIVLIPYVAERP